MTASAETNIMVKSYLHEAFEAAAGLNPLNNPKPKEDPFVDADLAQINESEKHQTAYATDKKDDDFELTRKERRKRKEAQSQSVLKASCLSACSVNIGELKISAQEALDYITEKRAELQEEIKQEEEVKESLEQKAEEQAAQDIQKFDEIQDRPALENHTTVRSDGSLLTTEVTITADNAELVRNAQIAAGIEPTIKITDQPDYKQYIDVAEMDMLLESEQLSPEVKEQLNTIKCESDCTNSKVLELTHEEALYINEKYNLNQNDPEQKVSIGAPLITEEGTVFSIEGDELVKLNEILRNTPEDALSEEDKILLDKTNEKLNKLYEDDTALANDQEMLKTAEPGHDICLSKQGQEACVMGEAQKDAQNNLTIEEQLNTVPDQYKSLYTDTYNQERAAIEAQGIEPVKATAEEDLAVKQTQTVTVAPGGM